jgi:hypothetical protein
MGAEAAKTAELLDAGDVPGAMRHLRFAAEKMTIEELAHVVGRASAMVGFDDLVEASSALSAAPERPQALYDFGYACIEHGAAYLAVPALSAALRLVPDALPVLTELVVALEDVGRHGEAVRLLEERAATLPPWPQGYLLVYNAILAGDLATATRHMARLPRPDDDQWAPAHHRVTRMLERAAVARSATPLDGTDLRGWQFVLTGGLLTTLSPYGFAAGMTGRYAYTQDSPGACRYGLSRLETVLAATGRRPSTVSLLTDRSSRILGLAAAEVLGVPAVPFAPGRPDTLVVAYDLNGSEEAAGLRERAADQVLYEHATCWTDPPPVPADVSTFLHQMAVPPWAEAMRGTPEGTMEKTPADDRPEAELAAEIVQASPDPDPGDGETPPDPDSALSAFASSVANEWATGVRDRVASPGPVPSSRFL